VLDDDERFALPAERRRIAQSALSFDSAFWSHGNGGPKRRRASCGRTRKQICVAM
jgi:hypothetical protein